MSNISKSSIYDSLIEDIKKIDTSNLSDDVSKDAVLTVVEEQKVYFWIRLYLKDENPNVEIGDDITITYIPFGEKLKTKFICYDKKGLNVDHMDELVNWTPEEDKKVLCLMVDTKKVNFNDEIPFIRTLFKTSYHYEYQLVKRDELIFTIDKNDVVLDYYDVDF